MQKAIQTLAKVLLALSIGGAGTADLSAQGGTQPFFGVRPGASSGGGAAVAEVAPGGTAAALGLRPGDVVVSLNGAAIDTTETMVGAVRQLRVGDAVTVRARRGAEIIELRGTVQAGTPVSQPRRAIQGEPSGGTGPAAAPAPAEIPAETARRTAELFAAALHDVYLDPAIGRRYAEAIRSDIAAGGYDHPFAAEALAARLTERAQAVSPDGHLRVFAGAPGQGGQRGPMRAGGTDAMPEARLLAPGIAYVRYDLFPNDPEVVAATRRFLMEQAGARTLIIDLRAHRGGGYPVMDAIFPFLFNHETVLLRTETRATVWRAGPARPTIRRIAGREGIVAEEHVAIPDASEPRLGGAQVFVLTSRGTASAAEHFALALSATGRATLIGEPTRGAGHFALGLTPLGDGFRAFIPSGRTLDPRSGRGWEGTGVAPQIRVPAARALVEALRRAGVADGEEERLAASVPAPPEITPPTQRLN